MKTLSFARDNWPPLLVVFSFSLCFFILLHNVAFAVPDGGTGIQGETFPSTHTAFAEGYLTDATQNVDLSAAGQNNWLEVDGCTSGDLNNWAEAGCDFTAGALAPETFYSINWSITFDGSANDDYDGGISINDAMDPGCRGAREGVVTGYYSSISGNCIVDINVGDVIKPEMRNITAGPADATVRNLTVVIHQL